MVKLIKDAPRDGTSVIVYHKVHGWIQAWFAIGEWMERPEYGREYSGDCWVLGDDLTQEQVEACPDGSYRDGQITHYIDLLPAPTRTFMCQHEDDKTCVWCAGDKNA